MPSPTPDSPAEHSPLSHKPFALFCSARVASSVAFQMQGVAVGWQIYSLTGSAWYLGLVGLAQFLPMFLLTLAVGHVADHYDRRMVVRSCQMVLGIAAAVLALGSLGGWQSKEGILCVMLVSGAARAFEMPGMQALMPGLVPRHSLARAAAWSASAGQTAIIIGPALGGILYLFGATLVYSTVSALYLAAAIFTTLIRVEPARIRRDAFSLSTLFAGITFIRSRPEILGAISLDLFAVLLGGATALLPIYARDILKTGPLGLGLLRSAPSVGALAMSVYLARHPLHHRIGRTMFGAVAVFGLATTLFAVSRSFPLSLATLVILGAADVISVVIRSSLVQIATPDGMRGRVSAVNSLFIGTSNQLGEFESGVTAALLGTVSAVLLGGIGTLLVVIAWIRFFPQLLSIDSIINGKNRS